MPNDRTMPEYAAHEDAKERLRVAARAVVDAAVDVSAADEADLDGREFDAAMDAQNEAVRQYLVLKDRQQRAFVAYRQAEHRRREAAKRNA